MIHHSYFDFTKIVEDYDQHFELVLIYNPRPGQANSIQLNEAISAALKLANVMPLHLPLAYRLLTAGHLDILMTKDFGELSSQTFLGKKGTRRVQIQVGTSYQKYIQPGELAIMHNWLNCVMGDWLHQQCQRSPKRPH